MRHRTMGLLRAIATGEPDAPCPTEMVRQALADALITGPAGATALGDLTLTRRGIAELRTSGLVVSVRGDADRLATAAAAAGDASVCGLARGLGVGVQRLIAAGDVLVVRGLARWSAVDPALEWRVASLCWTGGTTPEA